MPTSTVAVTAVDQTICFYDSSVTQTLIDAYQWTLMFGQAAARAVNPDPASGQYFDAMTQELAKIGWNITNAGKLNYNQQAAKISPAGIVSQILDPYLSQQQQKELGGILNAIQQPDGGIHNFVEFFWRHAHTQANRANMALGPLTNVNNAPDIKLVYYSFDYDADTRGSLFVEIDSAKLAVSAYNLEMNLNMAQYNAVSADLISRLSSKVDEHVMHDKIAL
jgi:hypothetical protein